LSGGSKIARDLFGLDQHGSSGSEIGGKQRLCSTPAATHVGPAGDPCGGHPCLHQRGSSGTATAGKQRLSLTPSTTQIGPQVDPCG
jgi:hypothetical protein